MRTTPACSFGLESDFRNAAEAETAASKGPAPPDCHDHTDQADDGDPEGPDDRTAQNKRVQPIGLIHFDLLEESFEYRTREGK
jgi:hypothetical protein